MKGINICAQLHTLCCSSTEGGVATCKVWARFSCSHANALGRRVLVVAGASCPHDLRVLACLTPGAGRPQSHHQWTP